MNHRRGWKLVFDEKEIVERKIFNENWFSVFLDFLCYCNFGKQEKEMNHSYFVKKL